MIDDVIQKERKKQTNAARGCIHNILFKMPDAF